MNEKKLNYGMLSHGSLGLFFDIINNERISSIYICVGFVDAYLFASFRKGLFGFFQPNVFSIKIHKAKIPFINSYNTNRVE